jgi:adenosylhomocysteine nucleosidase
MELRGRLKPGLPLLVVAVPEEARCLDTSLPVLLTGIGKVNAAAALARTLASGPAPSLVVNLGTAGALCAGLSGIHVVRSVMQHDLDTDLLLDLTGVAYGAPITLAADGTDGASQSGVVLASGDAFISDATVRDALARQADIVDMEGYAIAAAAKDAGVPVSMVKHVSDEADEHAARSWRESVAASAHELAAWASLSVPGY